MPSVDVSTPTNADFEIQKSSAGWRVICASPNASILEELNPVLSACMPKATISELRNYPQAPDLARLLATPTNLFFLDAISDPDAAVTVLSEITRLNRGVSVISLLATKESTLILRCLRQGAVDFFIQPFTVEQLDAAIRKLARILPKEKLAPRTSAKVICVVPSK